LLLGRVAQQQQQQQQQQQDVDDDDGYVPFGGDILEEPGCVLYRTEVESETPRSIGKKFGVDPADIVRLNRARFGNDAAPVRGFEMLTTASRLVRASMCLFAPPVPPASILPACSPSNSQCRALMATPAEMRHVCVRLPHERSS
jgi:hypothetical protein